MKSCLVSAIGSVNSVKAYTRQTALRLSIDTRGLSTSCLSLEIPSWKPIRTPGWRTSPLLLTRMAHFASLMYRLLLWPRFVCQTYYHRA
jgi:hypothetical protein